MPRILGKLGHTGRRANAAYSWQIGAYWSESKCRVFWANWGILVGEQIRGFLIQRSSVQCSAESTDCGHEQDISSALIQLTQLTSVDRTGTSASKVFGHCYELIKENGT